MLTNNSTLTLITHVGGSIRVKGGAAIAETLKINSTITSINLAGSRIAMQRACRIIEALKINSSLTSLILAQSGFTEGEEFPYHEA